MKKLKKTFTRKKSRFSIPITNWSQRTNNRKSNSIRNWALNFIIYLHVRFIFFFRLIKYQDIKKVLGTYIKG